MAHSNIYTKFMIEYDKANITSSYPSLTKYEVATILDKAYLALIAQKITGNNPRKVGFEADIKSIEDLRPLITKDEQDFINPTDTGLSENEYVCKTPSTMLYYIDANLCDKDGIIKENVRIINHQIADKFRKSEYNNPWMRTPVCFLEGSELHILSKESIDITERSIVFTFLKNPKKFVCDNTTTFDKDPDKNSDKDSDKDSLFELSDSVAEELINLAVLMALETVESPRYQVKQQSLILES